MSKPNAESGRTKRTRKKQLAGPELIAQDIESARLRITERKSYQQIADIQGFASTSAAHDSVMRCLKSQQFKAAEDMQAETLAILEEVANILLTNIRAGKTYDTERLVRVLDKRDRYVPGIEAPIQIEIETHEQVKSEAEDLIGKFRQKPQLSVVREEAS